MGLTLLQAPAGEPLTTAEVRAHLRYDDSGADAFIDTFLQVARQAVERRTGRALLSQQWRQTFDTWPDGGILYPRLAPLSSVQAISYLDPDGNRQTVSSGDYLISIDTAPGSIRPAYGKAWPSCRIEPGSVRVDFTAGYANAAAIPSCIRAWMLLAIGAWDKNRDALTSDQAAELPEDFFSGLLSDYIVEYL